MFSPRNAVGVVLLIAQGRLVPRQPRAIKRTTPTALHHEAIYNGRYIHGNIDINSTALCRCNIHNGKYIHGNIGIISAGLYHYNI